MESRTRTYVAGSAQDFDDLYRETYPRLVRTIGVMMRNSTEAEDCVQEAYVNAYKAWGRWRGDAPVEAWLWRIALNVAHSHMRANKIRTLPELIKRLGRPAVEQDPANQVVYQDIKRALLDLEPKVRTTVVLKYLHGFSGQEIADCIAVDVRTVNRWLAKAQEQLHDKLGDSWRSDESLVSAEEVLS